MRTDNVQWGTPRSEQGQMVVSEYGWCGGEYLCRTTSRTDGRVTLYRAVDSSAVPDDYDARSADYAPEVKWVRVTEEGRAVNGGGVGKGYDAEAIRYQGQILLALWSVADSEWVALGSIDDDGEDLETLAHQLADHPGSFDGTISWAHLDHHAEAFEAAAAQWERAEAKPELASEVA